MDPQACQSCHPNHFQEWAASMHAYSSDDPIFVAMNRRGQRETNHALGDFCVKCHAPMAVQQKLTSDGLNLADLPRKYKGVTCYFCHSIDAVAGTHNNPLVLASDGVMRGEFSDPVANQFHPSRYSNLLDPTSTEAASACGSCHDIVNTKGTAIERTFTEWQGSVFARTPNGTGCGQGCHMSQRTDVAAVGTGRQRSVHAHGMPGLDVALTPWPGKDQQREGIDTLLLQAVQGTICYQERTNRIQVIVDNSGAGHMWPSGASSDRRAWVEVIAYAGGQQIYQTGVVPAGGSIDTLDDPDLWLIRDCFFDEAGRDVHMFWEAKSVTTNLIPVSPLIVPGVPPPPLGHLRWDLPRVDSDRILPATPDRITMKVHIKAVGDDVIKDLVASGDLDATVAAAVPTYDVPGGTVEWTRDAVNKKFVDGRGSQVLCVIPPVPVYDPSTLSAVSHQRCDPPKM
jgi:hypothetical protein